jgi:hypothetical protein
MGANGCLRSVYGLTSGTRGGIMLKRRNTPKTCKCPRRSTLLPRIAPQFFLDRRSSRKPEGSIHANSWRVSVGPIRSNGADKLGPRGFGRTRQKAHYTLTCSPMLTAAACGVGILLDLSSCYYDNGRVRASHGISMRGGIPSAILCARQSKISCTTHSRVKFASVSLLQSARDSLCSRPVRL